MKVTCPVISPLFTPSICPLRIMCIAQIALQRSPGRLEGKEAHCGLDHPFDKAVVLLNEGIEVFDQALVRLPREVC
jgi:hypothetical protein